MATVTRIPFFNYEVTSEVEAHWVNPGPSDRDPDPDWRTVDSNGHGHFAQQVKGRVEHPTIEWVSEPCTVGHDEDCEAEGSYRCKTCGEEVRPGTVRAKPVQVGATRSFTLVAGSEGERVVYRFGDQEWEALLAGFDGVVRSVLAGHDVEHTRTQSPW